MKKRRWSRAEGRGAAIRACWMVLVVFAWSATAQEEAPLLQPPLGEIPLTYWEQHGLMVILGAGALITFVVLGIWFWLRPKPAEVLPPEEEARLALEALAKRPEDGAVISRTSQVLRQYVLAGFDLPPGQPTTAEFCHLIKCESKIGDEFATALTDFLRECDARKFAQSGSTASLNAVPRALKLVEQGEARRAQLRQMAANPNVRAVVAA